MCPPSPSPPHTKVLTGPPCPSHPGPPPWPGSTECLRPPSSTLPRPQAQPPRWFCVSLLLLPVLWGREAPARPLLPFPCPPGSISLSHLRPGLRKERSSHSPGPVVAPDVCVCCSVVELGCGMQGLVGAGPSSSPAAPWPAPLSLSVPSNHDALTCGVCRGASLASNSLCLHEHVASPSLPRWQTQ